MNPIIETALINAFLATLLAVLTVAVGRVVRRPALTHALWVLVLLKLITPPLFEMPTGMHLDISSVFPPSEEISFRSSLTSEPTHVHQTRFSTEKHSQVDSAGQLNELPISSDQTSENLVSSSLPNEAAISEPTQESEFQVEVVPSVPVVEPALQHPATHPPGWFWYPAYLFPFLVFVWITGTLIWFAVQGFRLCRFFRTLSRAKPASYEMQKQAQQLAKSMGLQSCPEIRVIPETISPMLWGLGWKTGLLFPTELLHRLDKDSNATLLVHELAHYYRGDHWVRLLEFVAGGLYWWHPVVWWAHRQIEETEEACCDAWVVSRFSDSPRRYAEALLETVDFLSETPKKMPLVISGIGDADSIRNRLRSIMLGTTPNKLSGSGRLLILVLALLLLPLTPGTSSSSSENAAAALSVSRPEEFSSFETNLNELSEDPEADQQKKDPPFSQSVEQSTEIPSSRTEKSEIWAEATSPDSGSIIVAKTDRSVYFQNNRNGFSVDLSDYEITSVAFSPDGRTFASGCLDGKVLLWDVSTGELLKSFPGHSGVVRSVVFSPDHGLLVSGGRDGKVRFWDVNARHLPETLSLWSNKLSPSQPVNCIRFSADGTLLAVAIGDWKSPEPGRIVLWDMNTLNQFKSITSETAAGAISFLPDGKSLLTGGWRGKVTLWDLATSRISTAGFISKDAISSAAFSPEHGILSRANFNQTAPSENSPPFAGSSPRYSFSNESSNGVPGISFDGYSNNSSPQAAVR